MFKDLTKFGTHRTTNQAIGFYIAYLIATMLVAMIAAGLFGAGASNSDAFATGVRIGSAVAILISVGLAYMVIQARKLGGEFKNILIGLLAGVLAYFGGGLLGLIPVAYLTTVKK